MDAQGESLTSERRPMNHPSSAEARARVNDSGAPASVVRFLIIVLSVPSRSYLQMQVSKRRVKCKGNKLPFPLRCSSFITGHGMVSRFRHALSVSIHEQVSWTRFVRFISGDYMEVKIIRAGLHFFNFN